MATETLDATGIRVDMIDTANRKRFGHPSWVVPFGGGRVEDAGVVVEVRPNVDMPTGQWRGYEEIEALADQVEADGGFMWQGDEIGVGDEIIVGKDALKLLSTMWERAEARNVDGEALAVARKQGEEAARRQVREELKAVASRT